MTALKKIDKRHIADQVYEQLKENIVRGTWQPGEKIPSETQLVSMFGVSRVSVREAIQRISALGLLDSKAGDGTYVREFDVTAYWNEVAPLTMKPADQLEVMELRKALESEALALAAERATDEDLLELERLYLRARKAFRELDLDTYFKEDFQFHIQIFKMTRNNLFISIMQTLGTVMFSHFNKIIRDFCGMYEVPSDEADLHTKILEALKRRDAQGAVGAYLKLNSELIDMYRVLQAREDAED